MNCGNEIKLNEMKNTILAVVNAVTGSNPVEVLNLCSFRLLYAIA